MIGADKCDGQQSWRCGYTAAGFRIAAPVLQMNQRERITEISATYQKHGWQLRRVLLRPETQTEIVVTEDTIARQKIQTAELDALWFSRPSHEGREAWELRLISETQYALFETFEADEAEEDREDVRLEMEARMREMMNAQRGMMKKNLQE